MDIAIHRITEPTADALSLLHEYYEAVQVQVRDTMAAVTAICDDPASGIWLAYNERHAVGCVVLRPLPSVDSAAECKRLYVQPTARGNRIAHRLMDALEDHATSLGHHWVYLDSKDDLQDAIRLYQKRGYTDCERYNDNPQATVFLRKELKAVVSE